MENLPKLMEELEQRLEVHDLLYRIPEAHAVSLSYASYKAVIEVIRDLQAKLAANEELAEMRTTDWSKENLDYTVESIAKLLGEVERYLAKIKKISDLAEEFETMQPTHRGGRYRILQGVNNKLIAQTLRLVVADFTNSLEASDD